MTGRVCKLGEASGSNLISSTVLSTARWIVATSALDGGYVSLWIDGQLRATIEGLRNDFGYVDAISWGAIQVLGDDVSGQLYLDEFSSFRTAVP